MPRRRVGNHQAVTTEATASVRRYRISNSSSASFSTLPRGRSLPPPPATGCDTDRMTKPPALTAIVNGIKEEDLAALSPGDALTLLQSLPRDCDARAARRRLAAVILRNVSLLDTLDTPPSRCFH